MTETRYVVEYFPEDSDVMETSFVEADSKAEAKALVVNRTSAFVNIVACNLTKTSGGPGATFQPDVPVQLADNEIVDAVETPVVAAPKKVKVTKEVKDKTPKDITKQPKVKGESYASRTRTILAECTAKDMTYDEKVVKISDELGFTIQKSKGYVTFYSK